jgi:hypothetical protein
MANNRSAIRDAIKALLLDETDAGANVYTSRTSPLWQSELPAILIYTEDESAKPESMRANSRSIRTLQVTIHAKIEASEDVDDDVDSLVAEIETLISEESSLGGTVLGSQLTNTETRVDMQGESEIGVAVLTYECLYIS